MVMTATKGYASLDAETGTIPLEQIDLDIARGISLFDDFIAESPSGNLGFSSLVSGPGSAVAVDVSMNDATHFGFVKLTAGGGAAGRRATHYLGAANLVVGGGYAFIEQLVYIPVLATLAEDFGLQIGVGNVFTNAVHNDGIYFKYDRATSLNWLAVTAANSIRTTVDTGVAVAAAAFIKLKAIVLPDASEVRFLIENGSPSAMNPVASISTNIPTDIARRYSIMNKIYNVNGANDKNIFVDYVRGSILFNARR